MATQETTSSRRRSLFRPLWACLGLLVVLGLGLGLSGVAGVRRDDAFPQAVGRRPGPGLLCGGRGPRRAGGGSRPGDEAAAQMGRGRRGQHREERPRLLRRGGQAGADGKGPFASASHVYQGPPSSLQRLPPLPRPGRHEGPRGDLRRRAAQRQSHRPYGGLDGQVGGHGGNWIRGGCSPCADNVIRSWRWAFSI